MTQDQMPNDSQPDNDTAEANEFEEKPKREETEFSFDFASLGESFNRLMGSLAGDEEVKTTSFDVPLENTTSARVEIDFSVGQNTVKALPVDSDNLFEAEIRHVGEVRLMQQGDTHKALKLSQNDQDMAANIGQRIRQGFRAVGDRTDLRWDIALSQRVPVDLEIDGGAGKIDLDLTWLNLSSLEIDAGVGQMTLMLPSQEDAYTVEMDTGVGQTRVVIPDGATVDLDIDAGVGEVQVIVPENAAVRLKGSSGIGEISVPPAMIRVKGKSEFMDNSGQWETEGFELAEQGITIKYDGGIGRFVIQYAETV